MSSHQNGRSLRVLVDMDCVLCDFEGHFLKTFRDKHPDDPFIPLESRNTLWVADQYGKIDRQLKVIRLQRLLPHLGVLPISI